MNLSSRLQRLLVVLVLGLALVTGLQAQKNNDFFRQQQQQLDRQRREEADRRNRERQEEANRRRHELDRQRREAEGLRRQELERRRREAVELRRQELDRQRQQRQAQPGTPTQPLRNQPGQPERKYLQPEPTPRKGLAKSLLHTTAISPQSPAKPGYVRPPLARPDTVKPAINREGIQKAKQLATNKALRDKTLPVEREEKEQAPKKAIASSRTASTSLIESQRNAIGTPRTSRVNTGNKTQNRLSSYRGKNGVAGGMLPAKLMPRTSKLLSGTKLPKKVADTFASGEYANRKLEGEEVYYKYHGVNNRTGRKHTWVVNRKYSTELKLREELAIRHDWGVDIKSVSELRVPSGTWVSEGKAAAQGQGYPGGAYQAVIRNTPKAWIVRTDPAFK